MKKGKATNFIKKQTDAINIPGNHKETKYSDINKKKSDTKAKNNNSKQQIIKKAKQQTNTNENKQQITIKQCKNSKNNIQPDNKDREQILRWVKIVDNKQEHNFKNLLFSNIIDNTQEQGFELKTKPTEGYVPVLLQKTEENKWKAIAPRTIMPIVKIEQKETKPVDKQQKSKLVAQKQQEKDIIDEMVEECLKVITKQEEALSKQEFKYLFRNTFQTNKARKIYNLALMCFKDMKIYHKTTQLATNILTEMLHMIKNYKKYDKQSFKKNIQALQNKNEYLTEQTKNIPKHISRFKKLCNKKQEQYIEQFFDNINQIISNNSDALDHLTNLMHTMERKNGMTF